MSDPVSNTMKIAQKISNIDGLENMLTGLGVAGKDSRVGGAFAYNRLTQGQVEIDHDSSDISHLVVNKIPELGTKKWLTHIVDQKEGGIDTVNDLTAEDKRLKAKRKFRQAWRWGRLYGGAAIYISVNDGLDPSEPLNLNRVFAINSLTVLHRWELQRGELTTDIDDPNFGLPDTYTISGRVTNDMPTIHHSRLLRFGGSVLSEQGFKNNDYWDDSVLSIIQGIIRDYQAAYDGIFHALQDFDVDILKLKDLAEIIAADDDDLIVSRLRLMQLSKSIMSSIIIDADSESFEKLSRQFANLDKVLEKCDKRLQLATGLPHTVLFGEGSTGTLGAGGESEQSTLNDLVASAQDDALTDNFTRYGEIVQAAKQGPTNGKILDTWSFIYNKLNEPTDMQVATTRKTIAETDKIYFDVGALSPDEIANSRFGGDEYSSETVIEAGPRKEQEETNKIKPEDANKLMNELKGKKE